MVGNTGRSFQGTGRIMPSMFGGIFGSYLPFNINVPDVFSGMYSLVNHYFGSDSSPRPYSSARKKHRTLVPTTTTTTTAEPEELSREEYVEEETDEEPNEAVEQTQEASKKLTNEDLQLMYQEFLRKKDEFDHLLNKKKKKKRKHKHDDFLHKIATHLAYLELEC